MKRKGAFCAASGLVLAAAAVCGVTVITVPAHAAAGLYVALGDSYTSGPLITPASATAPVECLQSAVNYPHLAARALGLSLTDASCAGATTSDLAQSQYPGVSPQFGALSASDSVVTLGIGGNDNETFITSVIGCAAIDVTDPLNIGAPCKAAFGNYFADNIASDGPAVGGAVRQIHALAPNARIYVVGYPDILPQSGNCWAQQPLTTGDVTYLNGIEHDLNAMLAQEAAANGATFVDTFDPSIGHDLCKPESVRWIEPLIPSSSAAFDHPNAAGEAALASMVEAAVNG